MFNCKNLVHPFQNDSGSSQPQRDMAELLSDAVKIDGRSLADLLNYFTELSSHIKYTSADYDENGRQYLTKEDNWQAFFKGSLPFMLAAAAKDKADTINEKFQLYTQIFNENPSARGLQLLIHFAYYSTVYKINKLYTGIRTNNLYTGIDDSKLVLISDLQKLATNKLQAPLKDFIKAAYSASSLLCIKYIEFEPVYTNTVLWNVTRSDVAGGNKDINKITDRHDQLIALQNAVSNAFTVLAEGMNMIADAAASNIQQSLLPLQDDLKQRHTPHLALLFTFLHIFSKLQNDLNGYTKKHLDFFYQDVLRLKPKDAQPDEIHLVFELQKQVKQYALKKGLLAKADKDNNGTEIDFATDDDIVVNTTQVAGLRTLFLNNEAASDTAVYVEGVYIAGKANTADGIDKDFTNDPKNYPTLGAKYSKYIVPGTSFFQPYPNARLGFILASPVLLLQEGKRTINIKLVCNMKDVCADILETNVTTATDPCCTGIKNTLAVKAEEKFPDFLSAKELYDIAVEVFKSSYVYISSALIQQASKQGIRKTTADAIKQQFLKDDCKKSACCNNEVFWKNDAVITWEIWQAFTAKLNNAEEATALDLIFLKRSPFKISFSGEKQWLNPDELTISFTPASSGLISDSGSFTIEINATITAEQPAVTFYNKDNLGEDFTITQPAVKIELDDTIKIELNQKLQDKLFINTKSTYCCLDKDFDLCAKEISLYHFFRDVIITDTTIDVTVCGLKTLIVQNDENVQNVNSLIYPFGTRPKLYANFYVGSKEIFSKNWEDLWINTEWKDRPADFKTYYEDYGYELFEDGSSTITDASFKVDSALLEKGQWLPDKVPSDTNGQKQLFKNDESPASFCTHPQPSYNQNNQEVYHYQASDFPDHVYLPKKLTAAQLLPLTVSSQYGFLRLTLDGVSFQNDRYTFVLARYMMALAKLSDPVNISQARTTSDAVLQTTIPAISTEIGKIKTNINHVITNIKDITKLIEETKKPAGISTLIAQLITALSEIDLNSAITDLNSAETKLDDATAALNQTPSDIAGALSSIADAILIINNLAGDGGTIATASNKIGDASDISNQLQSGINSFIERLNSIITDIQSAIDDIQTSLNKLDNETDGLIKTLTDQVTEVRDKLTPNEVFKTGTPPMPYTPLIKSFSIDYTAKADSNDIDLIHLYPYANTYKTEQLTLTPSLFPTFCDEGTLFIGLTGLVPGENVNMLFQLAEATSDSESDTQIVYWSYLYNNEWFSLRKGFEILDDATDNLTTSGIIKFALPENMSPDNTVMPKGVYWIKAAVPKNSKAVCETLGIYTQAIKAKFTIDSANDTSRLSMPLAANRVSKLKVADANIKQVTQPYSSFNGREPEETKHYYTRVSELLRHKGRAIQKFDYERLTLEAFPQIYKAKCINHSFKMDADKYMNDFPIAPGYVLIAVIPDLTKLFAGQSFEPKAPTGLLEEIEAYLSKRSSPFVRIKAVNPRYEKIDLCISVILIKGYDRNFYKEKLVQDVREFLAPWAVGVYDKLAFGECVNKSDIVHFLETRDYVDYITKMEIKSEITDVNNPNADFEICPATPRSILLAGEIQVCIEDNEPHVWFAPKCKEIIPVTDYCKPVKTIVI